MTKTKRSRRKALVPIRDPIPSLARCQSRKKPLHFLYLYFPFPSANPRSKHSMKLSGSHPTVTETKHHTSTAAKHWWKPKNLETIRFLSCLKQERKERERLRQCTTHLSLVSIERHRIIQDFTRYSYYMRRDIGSVCRDKKWQWRHHMWKWWWEQRERLCGGFLREKFRNDGVYCTFTELLGTGFQGSGVNSRRLSRRLLMRHSIPSRETMILSAFGGRREESEMSIMIESKNN